MVFWRSQPLDHDYDDDEDEEEVDDDPHHPRLIPASTFESYRQ